MAGGTDPPAAEEFLAPRLPRHRHRIIEAGAADLKFR
jgi:hypothetical protein